MDKDIARVLLSQEQIQARVEEMGRQIAWDYRVKNPAMVCILKGAVRFYTDLLRAMRPHPTFEEALTGALEELSAKLA